MIRSGGETYTKNTEGVKLNTGKVFEVQDLTGSGDYTVTIAAKGTAENDFEFRLGEESGYRWKDQNGKDYTDGFKITRTDAGFKIEYTDLTQIITTVKGTTAAVLSESAGGDLFTLTVTSGRGEITLGFNLYFPVTDVTIDPPEIVFPNPDEKPDEGNQPDEGQEPGDNDPDKQDSIAGVYKFYSLTDGTKTYYVGDTPEWGIVTPTLTEEYLIIELCEDGNGTLSVQYGPVDETQAFVWRTASDDPNKIILSAEGAKDSEVIREGEFIQFEMNGSTYILKKAAGGAENE